MNTIYISNNFEIDFCTTSQLGKSHQISFQTSTNVSFYLVELIHLDIWGPTTISSKEGYKYYIHFIDDYTKYTWIHPLHLKLEAKTIFQKFHILVQRYFERKIKILQTDWAVNTIILTFLDQIGIQFRHLCPYTPTKW